MWRGVGDCWGEEDLASEGLGKANVVEIMTIAT